ncbi:zinc finger protein 354B-like isoform X2 [Ruditapes philippinarum]|uniref:zinc finger protein 354B-like isoform X2 n=1 Tax=Ruditapes philippinarum TaxID=129788 RepID=UPI00295C2213|nr:zinc finger protein 354B-like isoform X2 [Ruditapes philippinarum]
MPRSLLFNVIEKHIIRLFYIDEKFLRQFKQLKQIDHGSINVCQCAMASVQVVKTEIEDLQAGDAGTDQQLIAVQTPTDDQQLIMVTFGGSGVTASDGTEGIYVEQDISEGGETRLCDNETQTETVFGLEDLPTVKEIVRKTIAKTRKLEQEQHKPTQDVTAGPINGIYTCNICAKVCRNKISWQNHLSAHNGDDVYMCGVCGQLFTLRITLKAHLDIHVREERKLKKQRDLMYGSADLKIGGVYMPGDIVPKDDDKSLNKQLCLDTGNILNQDGPHTDNYVAATEEVENIASPDSLNIKEDTELMEDGSVEDNEGGFVYACNICGVQYAVKEDCEKHLKVHTGGADQAGSSKEDSPVGSPSASPLEKIVSPPKNRWSSYIYACNVCGKQYTNKSNCKRHMMIHTDDRKLYKCEYCGKCFSQKYEVRMHARIHTGEKPFTCAVCGKTFTERGNWRRHTQIHVRPQEASPYRCGICCKGFFHAEKLQVHLQIHSGQRPFVCTVCGRKVKKIGDMYRHLRTHTGEKPYKCQVCGKGFAQNGNLKDHMKVHTGEKPHVCDLCGQGFARKILLKDHIKSQHRGTTLQDLTEAALEEIERQEAAMENLDGTETIAAGNVPKILSATTISKTIPTSALGKTIVIGGPEVTTADEAELLHEEQELELHDVHTTLTEKELEAAHVLTVVQDGDNMLYTLNPSTNQVQQIVVNSEQAEQVVVTTSAQSDLEVQNS